MLRSLFIFFLCLLSLPFQGQPDEVGCHYRRNAQARRDAQLPAADPIYTAWSNARSDTFDIEHYDIQIDVTAYAEKYIKANTTIQFFAKASGQSHIYFDLLELQVDSVLFEGQSLSFNYNGSILDITFPVAPEVGKSHVMQIFYQGFPHKDDHWGGFYFELGYIYSLGIGLSTVPPNFGKVWYPCFDSFVERATYRYRVISSGGKKAFCPGEFVLETPMGGDTLQREYYFDLPIPSYLSAIAVSDYHAQEYTHPAMMGPLGIRLISKTIDQEKMLANFVDLGRCIDALEYWYGPYVWSKVGYVITTEGAMEIPTNIAFPNSALSKGMNAVENLYAHELGHAWFGDLVSPESYPHLWMKEGPSSYSPMLVTEWKNGPAAFSEAVKNNQYRVLQDAHVQDEGFHPLSPLPDAHIYGSHCYYKGASVFHNLRAYLGDSLFRVAIQTVMDDFAFSHMTPYDFRDKIQAATGINMIHFFDDQIFQPGFAAFSLDSVKTLEQGGTYTHVLYVRQDLRACPNYYEDVPLEITYYDKNWEKHSFISEVSGRITVLNVETTDEAIHWAINTNNRLNLASLDFEQVYRPSDRGLHVLPWVDAWVSVDVADSCLFRIEHQWVAPEDAEVAPYVREVSDSHYWHVSGTDGQHEDFSARFYYEGKRSTDLDYNLLINGENNVILVYREHTAAKWQEYDNYDKLGGTPDDGSGYFRANSLAPGQYAFANAEDEWVSVRELHSTPVSVKLFPNPVSQELYIEGLKAVKTGHYYELYNLQGSLIRTGRISNTGLSELSVTDLSDLPSGAYVFCLKNESEGLVWSEAIEISR